MHTLQVLLGLAFFVGVALLLSEQRRAVPWKLVAFGFTLQLLIGVIVLHSPLGELLFVSLNAFFVELFRVTGEASGFLFGSLVEEQPFAFHILPTVIVFSALMALLYDLGVMGKVISALAWAMKRGLGVSPSEALAVAANVFAGQTEAPLVVRPYVAAMTRSQLMTLMTAGMATVAGSVMAAYVGILRESIPDIAGHLMSASLMSAPAAFIFAKIMCPETKEFEDEGSLSIPKNEGGPLYSLARGALDGLSLALNIAAMLIVFLAVLYLANTAFGALVRTIAEFFALQADSFDSLQEITGLVFAPFAWGMGIPADEMLAAGALMGEKTVLNEFVAYAHFAEMLEANPGALSEQSKIALSYALCGFANFGSIGILIGGIGGIAPERSAEIAKLGIRSLIAASLACFSTAAIASLLTF